MVHEKVYEGKNGSEGEVLTFLHVHVPCRLVHRVPRVLPLPYRNLSLGV